MANIEIVVDRIPKTSAKTSLVDTKPLIYQVCSGFMSLTYKPFVMSCTSMIDNFVED
jgi:hypothetical protein